MQHSTSKTRTEAKRQALSWLASQLSWEHTLDELRGHKVAAPKAA
jgi:hypothetical protein